MVNCLCYNYFTCRIKANIYLIYIELYINLLVTGYRYFKYWVLHIIFMPNRKLLR